MDFFTLLFYIILYGFFIAIACILLISVTTYLVTDPYPIVERYKDEETFKNHHTKSASKFPSMDDPHSVHLSVVVPAYNEEERLSPMLDEALKFFEERLNQHPAYKYEIIVVSDGSQDKTVEVAESYAEKFGSDKVRCLQLVKNRGKGGAVRLGVQSSRGAIILFADADGATKFEDVQKLEEALKRVVKHDYVKEPAAVADARALVVGSRAHLEEESLANRSVFRAFDVELLYIAQKLNIPIEEIPVRWTEIEGSKVTPVLSWIQMGCDLGLIWLKYTTGAWKIKCEKID